MRISHFPEVLLAAQLIFTSRGWGRVDDRGEVDDSVVDTLSDAEAALAMLRQRHFHQWYRIISEWDAEVGVVGAGSRLSFPERKSLEGVLGSITDGALRIAFTMITREEIRRG